MFKSGENRASFPRQLDEAGSAEAVRSITALFGGGALVGKSFLDIGCGSGLFSIAAARSGPACPPAAMNLFAGAQGNKAGLRNL